MANNKTTQDPEAAIQSALSNTELFLERNGKKLLAVLIAVIIIVGGYFAYQHLYRIPYIDQAATAMAYAQDQLEQDSLNLALKGNTKNLGFEQITSEYSGTPQANLAYHYMGICYLNLGEYQKAIDAFKQYSSVDGELAQIINAQNLGLTGDAYSQMDDMNNALEYYQMAAKQSDNTDTAPTYLKKAAIVNYTLGKFNDALTLFQNIKNSYPASIHARDIDKYIALTQQKL